MSAIDGVSETFDTSAWDAVPGFDDLTDLTYHRARAHGTVRIAFDRPDVLNAFRPAHRRRAAPRPRARAHLERRGLRAAHRQRAVGGERQVGLLHRRRPADPGSHGLPVRRGRGRARAVDPARLGRLHILECQRLIRFMPKVVICLVNGWAAGGGHSLHVVCDLTLASRARAVQADRRGRRVVRRRLRVGVPGPAGRPEVRPRDLLPRPGVLRRGRLPDGHGQQGRRRTPSSRRSAWSGAGSSTASRRRRSGC